MTRPRLWLSRVRLAVNGWREVSRTVWRWECAHYGLYEAGPRYYIRRKSKWHRTLF